MGVVKRAKKGIKGVARLASKLPGPIGLAASAIGGLAGDKDKPKRRSLINRIIRARTNALVQRERFKVLRYIK